ncbi:unnamed protein product [Mytilus coruscus]|uniref:G-protein coupled receptors family 1 profile domain-containing protein n=1 Tax=Mytilus coruscus TaxID=42192 RepID=A0A6J8CCE5_MYTCO|nr:unnamed protein product [Mytilus coruscus]
MNDFYTDGIHQNQCLFVTHIVPAALLSSLLMIFIMCLHRLNATFTVKKRILTVLTNDVAIGLGFLFSHVYYLFRCVLEFVDNVQRVEFPCSPKYNTQKRFLFYADVMHALFVTMIACCYIAVIIRMIRNRKKDNGIESLSELQIYQQRIRELRMRYNMITLSCIILITACSVLPRTIFALYINITGTLNGDIVRATNNMLLLNPLIDPFIYIFRIKEVRRQVICRCFRSNQTTPATTMIQPTNISTTVGKSTVPKQCKTAPTS